MIKKIPFFYPLSFLSILSQEKGKFCAMITAVKK